MLTWTATKVDAANYCVLRFYLEFFEKVKTPRTSFFEKGIHLHKLIENFWTKLGTEEEVKRKKKKYSNAEEFAEYGRGTWWARIIGAENSDRPISWGSKNEKEIKSEQGYLGWKIEEICKDIFPIFIQEGKPLYSELPFNFKFDGRKFKGKMDEVRLVERDGKLRTVIRDYKSGNPWVGEMKLKYDPQLTFYNLGLSTLCYYYEDFAKKCNMLEERAGLMGGEKILSDNIIMQFFMLEAFVENRKREEEAKLKGKKDFRKFEIIHETTRNDMHYSLLCKMLEGTEEIIKAGLIFAPHGRKCENCIVKGACNERTDCQTKPFKLYDEKPKQLELDFGGIPYEKPPKSKIVQRMLSQEYAKARKKGLIV